MEELTKAQLAFVIQDAQEEIDSLQYYITLLERVVKQQEILIDLLEIGKNEFVDKLYSQQTDDIANTVVNFISQN